MNEELRVRLFQDSSERLFSAVNDAQDQRAVRNPRTLPGNNSGLCQRHGEASALLRPAARAQPHGAAQLIAVQAAQRDVRDDGSFA